MRSGSAGSSLRMIMCVALLGMIGPRKLLRFYLVTDGTIAIKDCLDDDRDVEGVLPSVEPEPVRCPAQSVQISPRPCGNFTHVSLHNPRAPPA